VTLTTSTFGSPELSNATKWWWRVLKPFSDAFMAWLGDTGWQAPTLGGGWVANGVGTQAPPGYRIRGGVLYLRGTISGGALGTIFTLPVGYRIDVLNTGVVTLQAYGAAPASNAFVSLNSIRLVLP
jgi:hypothetical protein